MADSSILKPFILSFEGGYSNKKSDRGGATMKGVTLETFRKVYGASKTASDLKKITDEQWHHIFKNIIGMHVRQTKSTISQWLTYWLTSLTIVE